MLITHLKGDLRVSITAFESGRPDKVNAAGETGEQIFNISPKTSKLCFHLRIFVIQIKAAVARAASGFCF